MAIEEIRCKFCNYLLSYKGRAVEELTDVITHLGQQVCPKCSGSYTKDRELIIDFILELAFAPSACR